MMQAQGVAPSLQTQVQVDGVITMAHAKHIVRQLADNPEAAEQVAYTDPIIL
jgi:G3E family GTPase